MEHSLAATLWRLAGLAALVCANGLFVAAEFSIVTVRKTRVDQLIAEGHRGARAVRRAVSSPDRYIAATQLGITMASLGLGWLAEPALASIFEPELTPKWIALERPETTAIWLVKPLEIFMRAMSPFIRVVHGTAQGVIRLLGFSGADHRAMVHS